MFLSLAAALSSAMAFETVCLDLLVPEGAPEGTTAGTMAGCPRGAGGCVGALLGAEVGALVRFDISPA